MKHLTQNKGNLYIFITAMLWSMGGLLIKFVPGNPIAINGARSVIALLFFFLYRRSFRIRFNPIVLAAGVCLTLTNVLYVMANKLTTAGNAIVLQYLAPIFVLIWHSIYRKKLPSRQQIFFVLLAFFGMVLFFFDQLDGGKLLGNLLAREGMRGCLFSLLAICAGLAFSGVFFLNSLPNASSEDASMTGFLLSFLLSLPFLGQLDYANVSADAALLILGVFQVGLAYGFYSKGIRLTSPINASLIGLVETLLNPLWVLLFYGEMPGTFALFGAAVILIAVISNIIFSNRNTEL